MLSAGCCPLVLNRIHYPDMLRMEVWTDDLHLEFSVLTVSVLCTETIIIRE